ncbi:MAG TPA: zinc-dependent metalloprotease family protein [Chitinophagaceae bacterium]|nr:zinc-dependent metalloprotease family protein [Chitinophagaceae bacterium]
MRNLLLSATLLLCHYFVTAQQNFWQPAEESAIGKDLFTERQKPAAYKIFQLNESAFATATGLAPSEKSIPASQSTSVIGIPNAEGRIENFRVVDAPVMDPLLAARYPGIRSYAGVSVTDPSVTIRFSVSPQGVSAMILSASRPTIYIDPLSDNYYLVVSRTDVSNYRQPFTCETMNAIAEVADTPASTLRNADDGRLRTYRLALVASGEFSQYWLNGTETTDAERKAKVLAAMNDKMTRVNGIYERDFGVRLLLIANNDAVIYLNAATDPIGTTSSSWNTQTQTTCTNVIGSANYDVGHLVHRGPTNNGNAGCIGCVCKTNKGSGWTSYIDLSSDYFVVDYLTHELGHQFGGNHTFTHANEGTIAQVEPGSGSTIMSYAGITGATTDVQSHNDDYFHAITIQQVTDYIKSANGTCAVSTVTGNATPTANAGVDYVIPRSTPFVLSGTGSDADAGDVLTYCWEQNNPRATGSSTVPSATATAGPQFRSYLPVTSVSRTFPAINSIVSGTNSNKWEVLPSVARTLNFRFTVRDNHPGAGNNKSDDMVLTINGTAGPFAVTAPNTAVSWAANSAQTVTWSVNSTNVAPVSCANVKISISVDGGYTFSTLVASTANDGSEVVSIPNTPTATARIKVEAVGNIFFDISNTNFTISAPAACGDPTGLTSSAITNTTATISWTAVSGALSYDVDYKAASSGTWINAATATANLSADLSGLTLGTTYDWRVRATCDAGSGNYVQAQFTTTAPCNAPAGLSSSAITASSATVGWTAVSGANNYTVEYKTTAVSTWTTAASATTSTSQAISGLSASTTYDWRVRANCASGSSDYSQAQFTTSAAPVCPGTYDISTNGTRGGAATIPFNTDIKGLVNPSGDNDYYKFVITTGGTITMTLTTLPANYHLRLLNSSGSTLQTSSNSGTTNETINRTVTAGTYYARVYPSSSSQWNATNCYTLRVALGTASREEGLITGKLVSVFPNPVNRTVTISIPEIQGMADIRVFDIYGKLMQQRSSGQMNTQLDLSSLSSGIYVIKVMNNGKESMMKIVKQ